MLKKVLAIIVLILVVALIVLIKPEFKGKITKVTEPEKKETVEIVDKKIRLVATDCTNGKLSMAIRNDGNTAINKSELKVVINNEEKTVNFIDKGINSGEVSSYSDSITVYSGKLNIKVEGPDNTIGWGIDC